MSEEWIKRSDAIKAIARLHVLNDEKEIRRVYKANPHSTMTDFEDTLVSAFDAIYDIPSAQPKRGEWKVRGNPKRNLWECSLCRCTIYSESESDRNEFHKWCGRCGARMRGADGE